MITAIIVDDELNAIKVTKGFLKSFSHQIKLIATAQNVPDAKSIIEIEKPNLIFLDVELPPNSSFDLLLDLAYTSFEVIFITSYDKYAIQAIKHNALDFLLKPLVKEDFDLAVQKFLDKRKDQSEQDPRITNFLDYLKKSGKTEKIIIPISNGFQVLSIDDIIYCEADRNYTKFVLTNQKTLLSSKNLRRFEQLLDPNQFFRIHQSYLINLHFVSQYFREKEAKVKMENNVILPVARSKKIEFSERFHSR